MTPIVLTTEFTLRLAVHDGQYWSIIRWSTTATVVGVAAVTSYEHAYELIRAHGETGWTARLVPSR